MQINRLDLGDWIYLTQDKDL